MKGKVGVGPKSEKTKAKMRAAALRRYANPAEREKTQKAVKQAFEHIDRSGSNNPNYRTGEFCRRTTD
jgi:tartrate dehydratase alpha subunit/fumarate hydratase class I-like protein